MRTILYAACLAALLLPWVVTAHGTTDFTLDPRGAIATNRPDGHAPIGVMGDHVHREGEWMLGYRYMSMHMDGLRDGTSSVSPAELFARGYMVAPREMTMQMHMTGLMYAVNDELTLTLMVPFVTKKMTAQTMAGMRFSNRTEGLGDLRLAALYVLHTTPTQQLHLNLGLSLPTGSIDERGRTPMMANAKLPYGMQLGSGTFDLLPGLTWLGQRDAWSYGAQLMTTLHLGRNDEGYTLGDRAALTVWTARRLNAWFSASARLAGTAWDKIDGADSQLNPAMAPTADPDNYGGVRVDALVGLNLYVPEGRLAGHRFAIEVGMPVYEDLNGPLLETDWMITVGWQYAF